MPFETFGVDYLVTQFGLPRSEAAQALALLPFFSFFSPLIAPLVCSIRRQIVSVVIAQLVVGTSILCQIVSLPYAPHAYLCLMGLGHLVVANAVWLALAGVSRTEEEKTNAASLSSAIYAFSGFAFNWITGRVRDATGDYDAALFLLSMLIVVGSLIGVYLLTNGDWQQRMVEQVEGSVNAETSLLPEDFSSSMSPHVVDDHYFNPTSST